MSISASYPNIRPTLLLDFANSGRMDPRVTFSRASTATYFDETGVLQSAAIDTPRFDYDPATLAARGFLIEEQRSNIVYPSNFSSIGTVAVNNAWYEVNATLDTTVNAGVAPDGTNTAALLAVNAPATFNAVINRTANTTAATYAFSCFCKAVSTDTNVRLLLGGEITLTNNVRADFTLSGAGTASAATVTGTATAPSAPTIQAVGNGWYRCTIIVALTAPTNITGLVYPGNPNAQTTNSQTLVWGAQVEAGAFPTSYIPTTTTALTRSADVASVNTLSPWFNSASGTLYVEATTPPGLSGFPNAASINDGTASNRILQYIYINGYYSGITTGGVAQGNGLVATTPTIGARYKFASAYSTDLLQGALNGTAGTPDTTINLPSGLNIMRIGAGTSTPNFNSHIQRLTYYPRVLSSAELQAITT